jgi:acetate CoA/acetoacetate CoA-transferase beta subunit
VTAVGRRTLGGGPPQHTAKNAPKIVETLALPPASARIVDLVATELAVIAFCDGRAILQETRLGITVAEVVAATQARSA